MLDVLFIDDEPVIRSCIADALRGAGHQVTVACDGREGLALATSKSFDVVISDIRLPGIDGREILRRLREASPATDVILITGFGGVRDAVNALAEGAHDYLPKPIDPEELVLRLARIDQRRTLQRELAAARQELARDRQKRRIIGSSPEISRLVQKIETIAPSKASVLITGESGTGKDLAAQTLHALSPRRDHAFVAVNCAAFPESLLEAELFGHEKGAFTGAIKKREGRFKAADHGTLFLDEIAEIPPAAQAKLLRVLEEGAVQPLGTNDPVRVDVRVISATNQHLKERIADKRFREDLYYRLNVLDLHIPPLRERMSDLSLLVEHFMRSRCPKGCAHGMTMRAWTALQKYAFPGNVRELEHAIARACVLARGREIDLDHLPEDIAGPRPSGSSGQATRSLWMAMREFEREYLLRALSVTHGKKVEAAARLGISRKNLWEKLRAHDLGEHAAEDEAKQVSSL